MNHQNFSAAFSVDRSPEQLFEAINNVHGWWSEEMDGRTDKFGAESKFHHKDVRRSNQKVTEFVKGKKVVWHVVDSLTSFGLFQKT